MGINVDIVVETKDTISILVLPHFLRSTQFLLEHNLSITTSVLFPLFSAFGLEMENTKTTKSCHTQSLKINRREKMKPSVVWLLVIFVVNSVSCDNYCNDTLAKILFPQKACQLSFDCTSQTPELILSGCTGEGILNLTNSFYKLKKSQLLITIKKFSNFTLKSEEREEQYMLMRELNLFVQDGTKLTVKTKTFDQLIINAVFKDVKVLELEEKSFSSCWGNVWLLDSSASSHSAFSSSDMTVWGNDKELKFTKHTRPTLTPLQKFTSVYHIADKIRELEVTIYAILALCGAIVITLVALTACVSKRNGPVSSRSDMVPLENLPDVVPVSPKPLRNKEKSKTKNNPVIKVSRISKVLHGKRNNKPIVKQDAMENKYQRSPRPPLPLPKEFESY